MSARRASGRCRVLVPGQWPRQAPIGLLFPILLTFVAAVLSPTLAAEPTAPKGEPLAGEEPLGEGPETAEAGASPWEHGLWSGATPMMRIYVCSHARRSPSWCAEDQDLPSKAPLPEEQGPPLTAEDAGWLKFLEKADPANLSLEDIAVIRRRATERRDPQAMEILGFLYAQGGSVQRDYAEAYRWYGRAYLAGERSVRANMDIVWGLLQRHDIAAALALTREFNALAGGEQVPMEDNAEGAASAPSDRSPRAATTDPTGL